MNNNSLLASSSVNAQCGIFAGLCAGAASYLRSQERMKRGLIARSFRNTLNPILSETVPSVAIFFMSYEHLKKHLFNIDNVNNSYYQTFTERFVSAGIASSFSSFISNVGKVQNINFRSKALLPLRYASFFGTFELCKDLMNKKHENLNLLQVATSATISGTLSYGLYYPLSQYRNMSILRIDTGSIPISNASYYGINKQILYTNLYKGFRASFTKFLPSCVACSCAFEFSKRYLNR